MARRQQSLLEVKLALAEKYEQKARTTPSTPLRNRMKRRAAEYRRQAKGLTRQAGG